MALSNSAGTFSDGSSIAIGAGFQLAGVAEKGAQLTLRSSDGSALGSVSASTTDGSWSITLTSTLSVAGLVRADGSASTANGTYTLLSAREEAALAGKFSNEFTASGNTVLDLSRPVYVMTSASGPDWYIWSALDHGYVISQQAGSAEWYRERVTGAACAVRPDAVESWSADSLSASLIQAEMAQNGGVSAHETALAGVRMVSMNGQRDTCWVFTAEQTDVAGNASAKASLKVLVNPVTPPQLDLDPDSSGTQSASTSHYNASELVGGAAFVSHVAPLQRDTARFIDVVFSGAGLNTAMDRLQLDALVALNADLAPVSGKTVGGVAGVSYVYTSASQRLTLSKTAGTSFTGAEVEAVVESIKLQDVAAAPGVRSIAISLRDVANLSSPVVQASMTVHSNGLFIDMDPATSGNQLTSTRFVTDIAKWAPGVAFDAAVGVPTATSITTPRHRKTRRRC